MNFFDNEDRIIEWLQETVAYKGYSVLQESFELTQFYQSIFEASAWREWHNSAGKGAPPPDYYNTKLGVMMEVIRIDDHGHVGENGKYINPVNKKESQIQKELRKHMDCSDAYIFVNARTDLSTLEDHNYSFYKENFVRTVKKHAENISLYKSNHPDFKLAFLVFDESSAYIETDDPMIISQGKIAKGQPIFGRRYHYPVLDNNFMSIFKDYPVDYLIIFAPFKSYFSQSVDQEYPHVCVVDLSKYNFDNMLNYDAKRLISMEA